MFLDTNLLPKKMNEINYFKKVDGGCEIYSYSSKLESRNEVIVVKLDLEIENDFCVDSKALDMVRALQPADITITNSNFIIKSTNGKGKFTSRLLNEELFDLSSSLENEIEVDFDKLLKASAYVSKNEKKPVLTGVRVDSANNIYATDSFKAYFYKPNALTTSGITISTNFINLIKNIFDDINNIIIKYNNNILMIENNNIKIYGRLIDGAYPDMRKFVENVGKCQTIECDCDELKDRLEIASNVRANDELRTVVCLSRNKIEALGDDNYEAEIKFENQNNFTLKLQSDLLNQAIKTIEKPILNVLVSNGGVGLMLFITNEEQSEISLVSGIR